ncbi:hypothetical protein HS048_29825 [Planomonospora sp. ID91781]|uniref:hypothetical protein n=1 Tax=Planomonospora sp. ID91781 TaxID=2738135 RepID=UPI0018C3A9F0|nr:hypothetical protein [Planomonospora sp. ID91781]MBG0824901.1 hypothetical protein [Planomonospora sp. ID91781]
MAGMSRAAASKILSQLETEGRATRVSGGHDGRGRTPDRWHPVITDTPGPDSGTDAGESEEEHSPEPPAASVPHDDAPADSAEDAPAETPGDEEAVSAEEPEPDPEESIASPEADETDPAPEPTGDDEAEPETGDEPEEHTDHDASETPEEPDQPEDPARAQARTELLELAEFLLGTVNAMDTGEAILALGRLEMFVAKSAQVHRNARAMLTGTTPAPGRSSGSSRSGSGGAAVRPGQLRDRILAHLTAHPGKDFTPYEIGRVLESSSGAVANALDRLVNLGQVELTCERPRRFTATAEAVTQAAS